MSWFRGRPKAWRRVACGLLWAMAAVPGAGAATSISATVDRHVLTTDETVALVVQVSTNGTGIASRPELPNLPEFEVVGTSSTSRYELTPAGANMVMTYQYSLHPLRSGRLTIGPVTYAEGGRTYRTTPITLQVAKGTAPVPPPPASPPSATAPRGNADVRARANKSAPYVNEQVTWTAELWWTAEATPSDYTPPAFDGFWTEPLANRQPSRRLINGREYALQQIAVALFPLAPGRLTIPPATVEVSESPFGVSHKISSDPIVLQVRPLPEAGRPARFGGAVGDWSIRLQTDSQSVAAGDALGIAATVTGTGNVQALSVPVLTMPPGFEVRQAASEKRSSTSDSTVQGEAQFQWVAIPSQPGQFEVGPVELPFFDPASEQYRTATAGPLKVTITGQPIATPGLGETTRARLEAVQQALVELPREPRIGAPARPLYRDRVFLAAQFVPLLILAAGALYGARRRRLAADPTYLRLTEARRQINEDLMRLRGRLPAEDRAGFYAELHRAVLDYLSARADLPASRLSSETAASALRQAACEEAHAALAADVLAACERVRFSGSFDGADPAGDLRRTEELVRALERGRRVRRA